MTRSHRNRVGVFAVTLMLSVAFANVAGQTPVSADGGICTGGGNSAGYHGYSRPPYSWNETPEGVSGSLLVRVPNVCLTSFWPNNRSRAWVMLANQNASQSYAQTGYIRYTTSIPSGINQCMLSFAAYRHDVSQVQMTAYDLSTCLTTNSYYDYYVLYTGPAGSNPYPFSWQLAMKQGAYNTLLLTPWDPWGQGWSFQPQYYGEASYSDVNGIPGTAGAVANMDWIGIQSVDTGTLRYAPCYLILDIQSPRFNATSTSCQNVSMWTN